MTDSTETELKLALVKGKLSGARHAFGKVRLERTAIEDVYFDTPDGDLRRRGLVLRLRRDGDQWMQTLKATAVEHSVVPVRREWEVAVPDEHGVAPHLDLERFEIAPLRVLLRKGLETSALAPVFRNRTARERGTISHGESEIEVALDRGELSTYVNGERRRLPVAELELELKSGRPQDLVDVAASLAGGRHGCKLVPALRSKAERGYALAGSGGLSVARASARGFAERVNGDMRSADALRAVLRHGLAIVVTNADALRGGAAGEHLHQARVALRRMRSALRLFDPDSGDLPPDLRQQLAWLARALGEARDWDVIVDETLPSVLAALGPPADGSGRRLLKAARRAHDRALARAVVAVSSRRYARLVLDLARWTMAPAPEGSPAVQVLAAGMLDRAADRLFAKARSYARLAPRDRHRVRILAKRLRYALDLLASTLPAHGASDYIDSLADLQDSLGELNDAHAAVELLRDRVDDRDTAKALTAWFDGVAPALVARAGRQLRALARRPRPWAMK